MSTTLLDRLVHQLEKTQLSLEVLEHGLVHVEIDECAPVSPVERIQRMQEELYVLQIELRSLQDRATEEFFED
jgi:hypothetical protein